MSSIVSRKSSRFRYIEIIIFSSIPLILDRIVSGDSAFGFFYGSPYAAALPLVTAFYGLRFGLVAGSVAWGQAGIYHLLLQSGSVHAVSAAYSMQPLIVIVLSISLSLLIAFWRNRLSRFRKVLLGRYRRAVHRTIELGKQNEVLEKVNRVLEGRVSGQKDSITLLHGQVKKLAALNMDQALNTILETIALFTEMTSGSIWTMKDDSRVLVPVAVWGWDTEELREASLDPELSIEGYVYRNRKAYSMRMLLDSSEFDRFDTDRAVISLPIVVGVQTWGVLTVETLPFERYSQYTETILAILLSLAEPYLRQILEFENLNDKRELDAQTGYPLFSILYRSLEQEMERMKYEPRLVSLIVLEMANFSELLNQWTREQLKAMLVALKDDIDRVQSMKSKAFHFKEDSQLALLIYDLDQDGTSFFCLELLAMLSDYAYRIEAAPVPVELLLGFSSSSQNSSSADAMIDAAEYLISIQRI
jgi:hypothetical protein